MKCKIYGEFTIIGIVGVPMVIIIIYSFLIILYTQRIVKQECNRFVDLMYSEQIDFSKQHNTALVYQVNRQVQNVQWNVYVLNRLLKKVLEGQVTQSSTFKDVLIHVERTFDNTEDQELLDIFHSSYLLATSWYVRDKQYYDQLDAQQQIQLRNFTSVNTLLRPILLERDIALKNGVSRRFFIKNMYFGTQYDGMVNGPSANTTYRYLKNPSSCPTGQVYDSRCRYWFNDTVHQPSVSMYISSPKLQYSDKGNPFLASALCQRVEIPPYSKLSKTYETISLQGSLYSVFCNNLELTAVDTYFSNFNQKSAFKMLIDPSSQNAVYYSRFPLNKTQSLSLSKLELDTMTTKEQAKLFQEQLSKIYQSPILQVKKSLDMIQIQEQNYQMGFKFMRLMNPSDQNQTVYTNLLSSQQNSSDSQQDKEQEEEEKGKNLKEHYALLNTVWIADKLKDPWNLGYSINSAFILIDVLSKDALSVAGQQMQDEINQFFYYNFIAITIFFVIVLLQVIQRFIRIFRLIISPIKQLTNILNNISLDDENQICEIIGDQQQALKSLFSEDLFLSEDTKILYDSFVSLFKMLQFTQQNIFIETESQTLLNLNEQVVHFSKFKNYRAIGICHNNLGFIHFNAFRYEEALQEFSKAIIYANYEVKIYEDEEDDSFNLEQTENQSINSEIQRNISFMKSNYKNLIEQSKKKLSNLSGSKFMYNSGVSLLNKKMKKMKSSIQKRQKTKSKGGSNNNEISSDPSINPYRSSKKGIIFEDQHNKSDLGMSKSSPKRKKSPHGQKEQMLQSQIINYKQQNSLYFLSSHSLKKANKSNDQKQNQIKRITKQSSYQSEVIKERQFSIQKNQSQGDRSILQQSVNPLKSQVSKSSLQENDYYNLFFTLYSRKFNYAKSMLMLLERNSSCLKNMWTELEQLLLEILEIGSQISLSYHVKSGQYNCLVILLYVAEKLNSQDKIQYYMKYTQSLLEELLQERIQLDILQENVQNSNRTKNYTDSQIEDQDVFLNMELLKNRTYIQDFLQKQKLFAAKYSQQFPVVDDQYMLSLIEQEQFSASMKKQLKEEQNNNRDTDKVINRFKVQKSIYDNNSSQTNFNVPNSDIRKSFFSNQIPNIATINQLSQPQIKSQVLNSQISNENLNDKSQASQFYAAISPQSKKKTLKKKENFIISTQRQQILKQQQKSVTLKEDNNRITSFNKQNPTVSESIQQLASINKNRTISNRPIISQLIQAQENFRKESLNLSTSPKNPQQNTQKKQIVLSKKISQNKQQSKITSKSNVPQQKKTGQSITDLSNQDLYQKKLKYKIQKRLKKNIIQIKKNLKQASLCQVKMSVMNLNSLYLNTFNYQHPDIIISRMILIHSQLFIQQKKYYEAAMLLTEQLENSYYFDPCTRHRIVLILQILFKKANLQIPTQLKSILSCFNRSILYKVGLFSLCSTKINRLKAYLLTKQILSLILTKPQDQFGLLIYKSNSFLGVFQMMGIEQMNKLKDMVENSLLHIYKDQKIAQKHQGKESERKSSIQSSNQQSLNLFKNILNIDPIQSTPFNNYSPINQIRIQKSPLLLSSKVEDQSQSQISDFPSLQSGFSHHLLQGKESNRNIKVYFPNNSSFPSVNQLQNISNIQSTNQLSNTGDISPFKQLKNQNQQINIPSFQKLNSIRNTLLIESIKTPQNNQNNLIQLYNEFSPFNQANGQINSISFQDLDLKKKEFVSLDYVDEIEEDRYAKESYNETSNKKKGLLNTYQGNTNIQDSNIIDYTLNSQTNQNLVQRLQFNNFKSIVESPTGSNPQESSRQIQETHSSSNSEDDDQLQSKELDSFHFAENEFYSLKDIEEDLQSQDNLVNGKIKGIITSEQAFHLGVRKTILTHLYQENLNLLHSQVEAKINLSQSIKNETNKKIDYYANFNSFNQFCIKKYIICITDSSEIPNKNEKYEQMTQLLYKLNIELLILQLNQSSQFEEYNFPLCDYINEQLVVSIFYSEQKLLQYLYNNRQNQSTLTLPLIVEYFQTNFLFVLSF